MAEPLIFRIPDPADEELQLRERESDAEAAETEAEEAHVSAGGQRMRQQGQDSSASNCRAPFFVCQDQRQQISLSRNTT